MSALPGREGRRRLSCRDHRPAVNSATGAPATVWKTAHARVRVSGFAGMTEHMFA